MVRRMEFGLYVHYPYCRRVCPFCDFAVRKKAVGATARENDRVYLAALQKELQLTAPRFRNFKLKTIYLGGGTPSLFPLEYTQALLKTIRDTFDASRVEETTIEVDPTTADAEKIAGLLAAGITRFSLGIQALDDHLLELLERGYRADQALELIELCDRGGVPRLSADLMFGIPDQTLEIWQRDLRRLTAFPRIQHLSLYNLTVEPDGRFIRAMQRRDKTMPHEDLELEMQLHAVEALPQLGFEQYEVTAFARPGCEAVHNSGYWVGRPYLGIGLSAHSYLFPERWNNTVSLKTYCDRLAQGELPVAESERLTPEQQAFEFLMLRLRMRRGIKQHELEPFLGTAPADYAGLIERFVGSGHLEWRGDELRLSTAGMLISNEIFREFCLTPG